MKLVKKLALFVFGAFFVSVTFSPQAFAYGVYTNGTSGNDISSPQCNVTTYPTSSFGIVGATSGRAFNHNSCVGAEFAWAHGLSATAASLYMNLNAPIGTTASYGMIGPYGNCSKKDKVCQSENYGYNAAQDAFNYAKGQNAQSSMWWLDIETSNSWERNTLLNRDVIDGAVQFFKNNNLAVGIYSTPSMWNSVTGGYQNTLPVWIATNSSSPKSYCSSTYAFTGGQVYLVQYANPSSTFDSDYACP